jgi:hypothetical protein
VLLPIFDVPTLVIPTADAPIPTSDEAILVVDVVNLLDNEGVIPPGTDLSLKCVINDPLRTL